MSSFAASSPSSDLASVMNGTVNDTKLTDTDSDAQLLLSMDREMCKYESLTAKREHLQQELDRSSTSPSTKYSPGGQSKSVDSNFNMNFLTARAPLSPATRSSMRSLVDSMSPLSRKILLESLMEKDLHSGDDSSFADSKKKSPLTSRSSRKKSPGKQRVKITPPRVKLTTSPSKGRDGTALAPPLSSSAATLTMLDFEATDPNLNSSSGSNNRMRYREKGSSSGVPRHSVASPTEIAAQQLTAEIGTLEAELEKLIESKAERQAEEAESEISEISDVSSDMMYSERRRRKKERRKKKNGAGSTATKQKKYNPATHGNSTRRGTTTTTTTLGSMAGLGKAYGFETNETNNNRKIESGMRRLSKKSKIRKKREKGWIVSGDRPPVSDQRRFFIAEKSKRNSSKDVQKEKDLLAASLSNRTVFEYDDVHASRFVASAFGMSPRTASRAIFSKSKSKSKSKRLTFKNIQKGRIGFTKTTANQKLRELEILRRKMSVPRPEYSSAEDRIFFLHHR